MNGYPFPSLVLGPSNLKDKRLLSKSESIARLFLGRKKIDFYSRRVDFGSYLPYKIHSSITFPVKNRTVAEIKESRITISWRRLTEHVW